MCLPAWATSRTVSLSCQVSSRRRSKRTRKPTLGAFLDDNLDAGAADTFSSDYRDSCMLMRQPTQAIVATQHNDVALALNNSCD